MISSSLLKNKSLYQELLYWLLSFTLSSILIIASITLYSIIKKNNIDNLERKVNNLQELCLTGFKLHSDFLSCESINPHFFITGKSDLLQQDQILDDSIHNILNDILKSDLAISYHTENSIKRIKS